MPRKDERQNSILIISSSDKFCALVKKRLHGFITIDIKKSGAMARRSLPEREYDIVVIDAPLSDELGDHLALDVLEKSDASVLIVAPSEFYEGSSEVMVSKGILAIPKPLRENDLNKAITFLTAVREKIDRYKAKNALLEEKMEELRLISRVKITLVEKKHMTEDEAHKYIGKFAMDNGLSRKRAAEYIMNEM